MRAVWAWPGLSSNDTCTQGRRYGGGGGGCGTTILYALTEALKIMVGDTKWCDCPSLTSDALSLFWRV